MICIYTIELKKTMRGKVKWNNHGNISLKTRKNVWKHPKKLFLKVFRCAQHPKAGQNTQHPGCKNFPHSNWFEQ